MPVLLLDNLKCYLIAFDKDGNERDEYGSNLSQQILQVLSDEPITDVFMMSHGWLGDIDDAKKQYTRWIEAMAANKEDIERMRQVRPGFRPLLIGLHWPSKPWGNEELGGSQTASYAVSDSDLALEQPANQIETLVDQYAERIADTETSRQALRTLLSSAQEAAEFDTLPEDMQSAYKILDHESGLGSDGLDGDGVAAAPGDDRKGFNPDSIFQEAVNEVLDKGTVSFGIDSGDGLREAFLQPLRMLSFWKMKNRARQFGESGAHQLLKNLQEATSEAVRFHVMGHSFGCIVVSAMLAGLACIIHEQ